MKLRYLIFTLFVGIFINSQNVMTPERMLSLRKISVKAVSPDNSQLIYKVGETDLKTEKNVFKSFLFKENSISEINLGEKYIIQWDENGIYSVENGVIYISKDNAKTWSEFYKIGKEVQNIIISPNAKKVAFSKIVHVENVLGTDKYSDLHNSDVFIFTDLHNRHWDTWYEGKISHVFLVDISKNVSEAKDLLKGKKFSSPQMPFGGTEDFLWSPDSKKFLYITKEKIGVEYAKSTNTDIFSYDLESGETENITNGMMGYDVNPKFSPDGKFLTWQSMAVDGYEADKNDLIIMNWKTREKINLTKSWDETLDGDFFWSKNSKNIYFNASYRGVRQVFNLNIKTKKISQITKENFDVNKIYAETKNELLVSRVDFNHGADLFKISLKNGKFRQITDINKDKYAEIIPSKSELKIVETTDGKNMGVWFIYPPNFDPDKKYPTLLYCQGGPQSALTQFFSSRWNFALMAANGYIVVAPNRRGMPGWGVKWNSDISKDWGGQPIRDYLSAIDFAKKSPFVDSDRIGAVGASFGGYSVFMLAGVHEDRFKTFIAHDGLFDTKSWYGTTEELWFANYEMEGSYWENPESLSYTKFNPSNYVDKWNKPIMIIQGGLDFRVGYEQGQSAFQAARLKGLKAKMLYFPNENHWILHMQNALVWQREFFQWLKETL